MLDAARSIEFSSKEIRELHKIHAFGGACEGRGKKVFEAATLAMTMNEAASDAENTAVNGYVNCSHNTYYAN